jgi:hypothetical protein
MIMVATVGIFAEDEFGRAQAAIGALAGYCDYQDWLDARWGLQFGLALAGVEAEIVVVGLSSFLEWCSLTETSADERALDAFASAAPGAAGPLAVVLDRRLVSVQAP